MRHPSRSVDKRDWKVPELPCKESANYAQEAIEERDAVICALDTKEGMR